MAQLNHFHSKVIPIRLKEQTPDSLLHYLSSLFPRNRSLYPNHPPLPLPPHSPPDIAMNTDGTLDPRLLLSGNPPQPAPNILSVQGALKMAARAREDAQIKQKPKSHGTVAKRVCNRCGETGHTAIELGDDGQYKVPCNVSVYATTH